MCGSRSRKRLSSVAGNDDDNHAIYYRRLADQRLDGQVLDLKRKVEEIDRKVDLMAVRIGIIGAAGAVVVIIANIIGPVIANAIIKGGV